MLCIDQCVCIAGELFGSGTSSLVSRSQSMTTISNSTLSSSCSLQIGNSNTNDSLYTGESVRFFTWLFFLHTLCPLYSIYIFTYGSEKLGFYEASFRNFFVTLRWLTAWGGVHFSLCGSGSVKEGTAFRMKQYGTINKWTEGEANRMRTTRRWDRNLMTDSVSQIPLLFETISEAQWEIVCSWLPDCSAWDSSTKSVIVSEVLVENSVEKWREKRVASETEEKKNMSPPFFGLARVALRRWGWGKKVWNSQMTCQDRKQWSPNNTDVHDQVLIRIYRLLQHIFTIQLSVAWNCSCTV